MAWMQHVRQDVSETGITELRQNSQPTALCKWRLTAVKEMEVNF